MNDKAPNKRVRPRIEVEVPTPEAVADRDGADGADDSLPEIDRIPVEEIRVGAGGTLVVPREDLGADIDGASELDLAGMLAQKIRKPDRRADLVGVFVFGTAPPEGNRDRFLERLLGG